MRPHSSAAAATSFWLTWKGLCTCHADQVGFVGVDGVRNGRSQQCGNVPRVLLVAAIWTCDPVPYTILHLSDLDGSPMDPIGNDELLSSLVSDFERAATEDPRFGPPDALVISGDLVQGVRLGEPDHDAIIHAQYEVALDLVGRLCDRFLGGDRSRMVVVPGNHDVDWNVAFSAMQPIPNDDLVMSPIRPQDMGPRADVRWDWRERRAYRIVDRSRYDARLDQYRRFVAEVYAGSALRYPIDPSAGYALFELNAGRVGVAAFNSCYGNDCFAFHGAIAPDALAQAHMDLHDQGRGYDILMAVWHHSIEGPPDATDYMDIATIYDLIGRGFRPRVTRPSASWPSVKPLPPLSTTRTDGHSQRRIPLREFRRTSHRRQPPV